MLLKNIGVSHTRDMRGEEVLIYSEIIILAIGFISTQLLLIFRKYISWRMSRIGGGSTILVIENVNGQKAIAMIRPKWKKEFEDFGGKVEDGETGLQCAEREFEEEASDLLNLSGIDYYKELKVQELMMRSTGTKGYLWTVRVLFCRSRMDLRVVEGMRIKDFGNLEKGECTEVCFIESGKLYRKGRERETITGQYMPISGRTRRILADGRIRKCIGDAISNMSCSESDSSAILFNGKTPPEEEMV